MTFLADGRERQEWYRVAPIIAALTGVSMRSIIPERYQEEEAAHAPTPAESARGWKVLGMGLLGAPPRD